MTCIPHLKNCRTLADSLQTTTLVILERMSLQICRGKSTDTCIRLHQMACWELRRSMALLSALVAALPPALSLGSDLLWWPSWALRIPWLPWNLQWSMDSWERFPFLSTFLFWPKFLLPIFQLKQISDLSNQQMLVSHKDSYHISLSLAPSLLHARWNKQQTNKLFLLFFKYILGQKGLPSSQIGHIYDSQL